MLTSSNLAKAQQIAESVVGAVQWQGSEGLCTCPGLALHTTANAVTDCKVVCTPIQTGNGILPPGIYCFHDSCEAVVDQENRRLRGALGAGKHRKLGPIGRPIVAPPRSKPTFDPAKLEKLARKLECVNDCWFAARSRKRVDNRTPSSVLRELYLQGEHVLVFDEFKSQGQKLWTHHGNPFDARELDAFRTGKRLGVWFLANPVSGEYFETGKLKMNGDPHCSRRTWRCVTSWRYLVLESDHANPIHWMAALAQMPLPIAAIYSSGGKSIHALIRLDAENKRHWDAEADRLKPALITLGACRKAITAVRLTRLPCCERLGSTDNFGVYVRFPEPRLQRLIYLNGTPDTSPIADLPVNARCPMKWGCADQDGFDGEEAIR